MSKITVPTKRFTHIHIDLVGPLPASEGYSYHLTTRWPEAIPINNTSTSECAKTLIRHWISRFGVPLDMTSDRGPQFTSVLWNDIADKLGISIYCTCAYHPQSNGLVERFHRSLEAALKARLHGHNWVDKLHWVLLGLGTVPKEDLETSFAELVYGEPDTGHKSLASHKHSLSNNFSEGYTHVSSWNHYTTPIAHHKRCAIRLHPAR